MSKANRPLSPHLSVYKWRVHMMTSILHRVTGAALSVGTVVFVIWLAAIASGAASYDAFMEYAKHPLSQVVLFGMTFALMQHMASGIRHLFMDKGDLYDLKANTMSAWITYGFSVVTTVAIWAFGLGLIGGAA